MWGALLRQHISLHFTVTCVSFSVFLSLSLPLSNPRWELTSLQKKGMVLLFCMHSIPSPFSTDVEVCSASHFHSAPLPLLRLAFCLIRSWRRWQWQYSSSGDDGGMSGVGCQEQSEMIGACQNAIWRLRWSRDERRIWTERREGRLCLPVCPEIQDKVLWGHSLSNKTILFLLPSDSLLNTSTH